MNLRCRRASGNLRAWFDTREDAEAFAADPANTAYHGDVPVLCLNRDCGGWHLSQPHWPDARAAANAIVNAFTKSDRLFLHAVGIDPDSAVVVSRPDGTVKILERLGIPVTRENYLRLAFAGHPPVELDGEIEAMIPEELRADENTDDDNDDTCDAPSAGWCGEPPHTPVTAPDPEPAEGDDEEED